MGEREVMRLLLALTFLVAVALAQQSFTPPFYRTLEFHQPMFSGNDVYILQSLLNRDPAVTPNITVDGYFGRDTQTAVKQFQGTWQTNTPTICVSLSLLATNTKSTFQCTPTVPSRQTQLCSTAKEKLGWFSRPTLTDKTMATAMLSTNCRDLEAHQPD